MLKSGHDLGGDEMTRRFGGLVVQPGILIRDRFQKDQRKAQRDFLRSGQPILGLPPKVLLQVALPMPHTASIIEPTSPRSRDV